MAPLEESGIVPTDRCGKQGVEHPGGCHVRVAVTPEERSGLGMLSWGQVVPVAVTLDAASLRMGPGLR